jgi:hypothetical protein
MDPLQKTLLVLLIVLIVGALVVAAALAVAWRWLILRIARAVAEATERRLHSTIGPHAARAGIEFAGVTDPATRARYLNDIDRIARIMDRLIPLPGVGGIGLDALLGLVPGIGDVVSFCISSLIVIRAAQLGVPANVLSSLMSIQLTDLLIGVVPIIGDVADVAYQADMRSAAVIRAWIASHS